MSTVRLSLAAMALDWLPAMRGYRDDRYRRFGRIAARIDDTLGYLPVARDLPRALGLVQHGLVAWLVVGAGIGAAHA